MQVLKPFSRIVLGLSLAMVSQMSWAYCVGSGQLDASGVCRYYDGSYSDYTLGTTPIQLDGGSNNRQPTAPVLRWYDTFGAVAYDHTGSTYGYSSGQASSQAAAQAAELDCGMQSCKVTYQYSNQCAAMSYGKMVKGTKSFIKASTDKSEAESKALAACQKGGASNCKIIMSECSSPYQAP